MPRTIAKIAFLALIVVALVGGALAMSRPSGNRVDFNFRVTLIPVAGHIDQVQPALKFNPADLSTASGTVTVPLSGLETGIALRDEHAKRFLGAAAHPQAVFVLSHISGVKALEPGKEVKATVDGQFTLNGVTHTLQAPIQLELQDGKIQVSTGFNVILTDYNIRILGADPATDVKVSFIVPVR